MNLSLYTGAVKPYLEYGYVCTPNSDGHPLIQDVITTLYLNTEIADTHGNGVLNPGVFPTGTTQATTDLTLNAGTYLYEANTCFSSGGGTDTNRFDAIFSLYNSTAGAYITRKAVPSNIFDVCVIANLNGQFTIPSAANIELRVLEHAWLNSTNSSAITNIGRKSAYAATTNTTQNADQRTTIKLWKLA
jgi:hypothetical protein